MKKLVSAGIFVRLYIAGSPIPARQRVHRSSRVKPFDQFEPRDTLSDNDLEVNIVEDKTPFDNSFLVP